MRVEKTRAGCQHVVERHAERDAAVMDVERIAHVPAADVEEPHAMRELGIERRTLGAHEPIVDEYAQVSWLPGRVSVCSSRASSSADIQSAGGMHVSWLEGIMNR